ncbi:MAG: uncharacterized protein KVP18_001443 [Porospora cf. gigantea A]|uniref:uncharacterized protein n=1 Tax=Porospora cf. gigantea A TaxID=2853593 RepID=UPI003559A10B|nr:MAG: hypothetical protein KVP18_001443 [Porospora cf. gigantea A]
MPRFVLLESYAGVAIYDVWITRVTAVLSLKTPLDPDLLPDFAVLCSTVDDSQERTRMLAVVVDNTMLRPCYLLMGWEVTDVLDGIPSDEIAVIAPDSFESLWEPGLVVGDVTMAVDKRTVVLCSSTIGLYVYDLNSFALVTSDSCARRVMRLTKHACPRSVQSLFSDDFEPADNTVSEIDATVKEFIAVCSDHRLGILVKGRVWWTAICDEVVPYNISLHLLSAPTGLLVYYLATEACRVHAAIVRLPSSQDQSPVPFIPQRATLCLSKALSLPKRSRTLFREVLFDGLPGMQVTAEPVQYHDTQVTQLDPHSWKQRDSAAGFSTTEMPEMTCVALSLTMQLDGASVVSGWHDGTIVLRRLFGNAGVISVHLDSPATAPATDSSSTQSHEETNENPDLDALRESATTRQPFESADQSSTPQRLLLKRTVGHPTAMMVSKNDILLVGTSTGHLALYSLPQLHSLFSASFTACAVSRVQAAVVTSGWSDVEGAWYPGEPERGGTLKYVCLVTASEVVLVNLPAAVSDPTAVASRHLAVSRVPRVFDVIVFKDQVAIACPNQVHIFDIKTGQMLDSTSMPVVPLPIVETPHGLTMERSRISLSAEIFLSYCAQLAQSRGFSGRALASLLQLSAVFLPWSLSCGWSQSLLAQFPDLSLLCLPYSLEFFTKEFRATALSVPPAMQNNIPNHTHHRVVNKTLAKLNIDAGTVFWEGGEYLRRPGVERCRQFVITDCVIRLLQAKTSLGRTPLFQQLMEPVSDIRQQLFLKFVSCQSLALFLSRVIAGGSGAPVTETACKYLGDAVAAVSKTDLLPLVDDAVSYLCTLDLPSKYVQPDPTLSKLHLVSLFVELTSQPRVEFSRGSLRAFRSILDLTPQRQNPSLLPSTALLLASYVVLKRFDDIQSILGRERAFPYLMIVARRLLVVSIGWSPNQPLPYGGVCSLEGVSPVHLPAQLKRLPPPTQKESQAFLEFLTPVLTRHFPFWRRGLLVPVETVDMVQRCNVKPPSYTANLRQLLPLCQYTVFVEERYPEYVKKTDWTVDYLDAESVVQKHRVPYWLVNQSVLSSVMFRVFFRSLDPQWHAAMQTFLMQLGREDPLLLVSCLSALIKCAEYISVALFSVQRLIGLFPIRTAPIVPLILEFIVKSLDPTDSKFRKVALHPATAVVHHLTHHTNSVSFSQKAQKIAVQGPEGVVKIFDFRLATLVKSLTLDPPGACFAFDADGSCLVVYSALGCQLRRYAIHSRGILGGFMSSAPSTATVRLPPISVPPLTATELDRLGEDSAGDTLTRAVALRTRVLEIGRGFWEVKREDARRYQFKFDEDSTPQQ